MEIREAKAGDSPAIAAIYAPFVRDTSVSFETVEPDGEEIARRIAASGDHHPWLVCERSNELLGYAYASQHRGRAAYRWIVEVSVYVREDARRAHIARGLYSALLDIAGLQRRCVALAGITLPNPASVGFHESFGFERVAVYPNMGHKFGAWHDVGWWQRTIDTLPSTPDEPESLAALRNTPAFTAALRAGEARIAR